MRKALIRIGLAVATGLAWGVAWIPLGCVMGWFIAGELEPEWVGGPLYAGFACGVIFYAIAGATGRGRVFEIPLRPAAFQGFASGVLAGFLWMVVVILSDPAQWLLIGVVVSTLAALGALSGAASSLVVRVMNDEETVRQTL